MKNANSSEKNLASLLKKIPVVPSPDFSDADNPVSVLIMSYMMWESTTKKAITAFEQLQEEMVDYNDLRVCMPHEVVDMIGTRYPKAQDRCERLRATLRDIYLREHSVTLEPLKTQGKREIRKYIDTLDGIVPYVAARVQLLSFNAHGIPVDDQLLEMLIGAKIADDDTSVIDLTNWLGRQIKAEKGLETHLALQDWVDQGPGKTTTRRPATSNKVAKKPASKTARKTGTRKSPAKA